MNDDKDKLLLNLAKARLYLQLAVLDTHDNVTVEEIGKTHRALQVLSHEVNDHRVSAFDGTVMLLPRECNDCANGIKHLHPIVRRGA